MDDEAPPFVRTAARCAVVSAWVGAVGIVCLVLLYVGFLPGLDALRVFGPLNDALIVVQYLLAVPVAVALHRAQGPRPPALSRAALLTAFLGIFGTVAFQLLLLSGVMDFSEQVAYASAFLLVVGAWIAMASTIARRSGTLDVSNGAVVLGALYIGYPLWAYRVGQQLLARGQRVHGDAG